MPIRDVVHRRMMYALKVEIKMPDGFTIDVGLTNVMADTLAEAKEILTEFVRPNLEPTAELIIYEKHWNDSVIVKLPLDMAE